MIGLVVLAGVCAVIAFFVEWIRSPRDGAAQFFMPILAAFAILVMVVGAGYVMGIR